MPFITSCDNDEMQYVLYDGTIKLEGYIIFRKPKTDYLYCFDLENNRVQEISLAESKGIDGIYKTYNFYKEGEKNIMVKTGINENRNILLQFISIPEYKIEKEIIINDYKWSQIDGFFQYLDATNELFCRYYYYTEEELPDIFVDLDEMKISEIPSGTTSTPTPFAFYGGKYICINYLGIFYSEDIATRVKNSSLFVKTTSPDVVYSNVLKKALVTNKIGNRTTAQVYDFETGITSNTGIEPVKYDRFADDKNKYHFFGDKYILYAKEESMFKRFMSIFGIGSSFKYMIYDYTVNKDVGYVKDCNIVKVLDCFP
jgi:hypothetical protein